MSKINSKLLACILSLSLLNGCAHFTKHDTNPISPTNRLIVFTSHKSEVYAPIIKEFELRTGISVEVQAGGTTEMLEKIKNGEEADVMFGGDIQNYTYYNDYIEPYVASESSSLDFRYLEHHDNYTFFSQLPLVFIYNNKLVNNQRAPQKWSDFCDESWKGKISFADPHTSGTSISILNAFMTLNDPTYIDKFYQQLDGHVASGSGDVIREISTGTRLIGITLEETAKKAMLTDTNITMVYPDYLFVISDGSFLVKNAKNAENAKKFIDFTISKDAQQFLSSTMYRRSVRQDINQLTALTDLADYQNLVPWSNFRQEEILQLWDISTKINK